MAAKNPEWQGDIAEIPFDALRSAINTKWLTPRQRYMARALVAGRVPTASLVGAAEQSCPFCGAQDTLLHRYSCSVWEPFEHRDKQLLASQWAEMNSGSTLSSTSTWMAV